jgi:hypothetical protein
MIESLSRKVASEIFKEFNIGNDKCQRLEAKGGSYPDKETRLGGVCEQAFAEMLEKAIRNSL